MKNVFRRTLVATMVLSHFAAFAQFSPVQGDNGQANPQVIGDTTLNDVRTNSQATQTGNSANNNGASITTNPDIRTQISPNINPNTTSSATGAILGNESRAAASNGNQSTNASSQNDNRSTAGVTGSGNSTGTLTGTQTGTVTGTQDVRTGANTLTGGPQTLTGTQALTTGATTATGGRTTGTVTGAPQTATVTGGNQALTGGAVTTAAGALSQGSRVSTGSTSTSVDASTQNDNRSRITFIPSVIPPTPPSTIVSGGIIKETMACTALQRVLKFDVNGQAIGWFWNTTIKQGETYEIHEDFWYDAKGEEHSFREETVAGKMRLKGSQTVIAFTKVQVSAAKNAAFGGGGGGGGWGQAGGGTSGAMEQFVTNIQIVPCFLPLEEPPQQQPEQRKPERNPCLQDVVPTKKNPATQIWICKIPG